MDIINKKIIKNSTNKIKNRIILLKKYCCAKMYYQSYSAQEQQFDQKLN